MARQTGGYYAAKPKDTTFTADWYQKNMPSDVAENQSGALGISKDQLYKLYSNFAQANPGVRATWEPTYTNPTQTYTPGGGAGVGGGGTVQSAPPAWGWLQQQVATQKAQQVLNPQQQQAATPQWQMPQLRPTQPTPTVPITPLAATPQFGATSQGAAPTMSVPQANAAGAAPLFSLGGGQNWMLPQAQVPPPPMSTGAQALGGGPAATAMQATPGIRPYQPVQQFQSGGPVQAQNQPQTGYQTGTSDPGAGTGWYDPLYSGAALGAWALGMPMVVNPTPSGTPSAKSGVAAVGQPTVYQAPYGAQGGLQLPSGQTYTAQQVASFSPSDWQEIVKAGYRGGPTGTTEGGTSPNLPPGQEMGPWAREPGIFLKAPMPTVGSAQAAGWTGNPNMPLTARTPANAAQMPQMNITPAANAGAAVPQQVAGQPPAAPALTAANVWGAAPAPYTGSVHDDPYMSHAVSSLLGFPTNPWHDVNPHTGTPYGGQAAAGANTALSTKPTVITPKKMQTGGPVPGQGDDDTVPALLTPGEYVLNQQQVQRLRQGRPVNLGQLPQQGQQPQQQPQQPQQSQQGQPMTTPNSLVSQANQLAMMRAHATMAQNAALSANTPAWSGATTPAAQGYAAAANAGQITGGAPTTAELSKAAAMTPGQIQGSIAKANMPGAAMASGVGAIGQGIAQAVQTWANSVKPWQMQASAIPNPDDFKRNQQQISLQEPRVV